MSRYTLDTDTMTLPLRGHANIGKRAAEEEPENLSVTIITVEEALGGWYAQIRRAKKDVQTLQAYAALQQVIEFLGSISVLGFDEEALLLLQQFRKGKYHVGTNDLKIAAIAKHNGTILVTRNTRDFNRIPGIDVEDWS